MRKKLVVANWKMNGNAESFKDVIRMNETLVNQTCDLEVLYCVPAVLLPRLYDLKLENISIGAQNCHHLPSGAFTGDIAAPMLKEAGACSVILGHSERRMTHGETNAMVAQKAVQAHTAGLRALICVGESATERTESRVLEVIMEQLKGSLPSTATCDNTLISYEPIWAIGTGLIPTLEDIHEVHDAIEAHIQTRFGAPFSILYGGSVKPSNAVDIARIPYVDGALVGGASLCYADFYPIVKAFLG